MAALFTFTALGAAAAQLDDLGPWRDCLSAAIVKFDDRHSDARTVAAAVVALCRPERIKIVKARLIARGLAGLDPAKDAATAIDSLREQDIDFASVIVLDQRRN